LRSSGIAAAYCKFDLSTLSRGTSERWGNYSQGIQSGVYSINEVRSLEGLPPIPDGDIHYVPLNLAPVGISTVEEE
jgi:phage portal protein BeeE